MFWWWDFMHYMQLKYYGFKNMDLLMLHKQNQMARSLPNTFFNMLCTWVQAVIYIKKHPLFPLKTFIKHYVPVLHQSRILTWQKPHIFLPDITIDLAHHTEHPLNIFAVTLMLRSFCTANTINFIDQIPGKCWLSSCKYHNGTSRIGFRTGAHTSAYCSNHILVNNIPNP